jgi:acyl carrier protein
LGPIDKLDSAFRTGLALSPDFDVRSVSSGDTKQWDSVAHLQLVAAIEKSFGVRLTPGDVIDLTSYPAAVEILKRLGGWPGERA